MNDFINKPILFKIVIIVLTIVSFKLFYDNQKLNNRIEQFEELFAENLQKNAKINYIEQGKLKSDKNQLDSIYKSLDEIKNNFLAKIKSKEIREEKANVNKIQLSLPLLPANIYDPIQCRKSAVFFVSTTLCVHDINKDVYVSASIWKDGLWEQEILGK